MTIKKLDPGKNWHSIVLTSKINELVDAVNALSRQMPRIQSHVDFHTPLGPSPRNDTKVSDHVLEELRKSIKNNPTFKKAQQKLKRELRGRKATRRRR